MKFHMARPSSFLVLDLPDFVAMRGYILLHGGSQPVYVEDYRQQVEERILSQVIEHPTVQALSRGEAVSDEQLLDLERSLRQELGAGDLELNEGNILKAYAIRVSSLIEFLRYLLDLPGVPDYHEIVRRQFDATIFLQKKNGLMMTWVSSPQDSRQPQVIIFGLGVVFVAKFSFRTF